jgi:hypothetical protein
VRVLDEYSPTVFIYSCPPSSKIKQKMVYSSSKAALLNYIEKDINMSLARKYEVDGPAEITDDLIEPDLAEASAKASGSSSAASTGPTKLAFKRPVAPGRPRSSQSNEDPVAAPKASSSGGSISSRIAAFEKRDSDVKAASPKMVTNSSTSSSTKSAAAKTEAPKGEEPASPMEEELQSAVTNESDSGKAADMDVDSPADDSGPVEDKEEYVPIEKEQSGGDSEKPKTAQPDEPEVDDAEWD